MNKIQHYLALGDSYTIGEAVAPNESFPFQLAALLRSDEHPVDELRVVAKTGWTTDELSAAIDEAEQASPINHNYDLVSLLIGVNNQYRGRSVENFIEEFTDLLVRAIGYAQNDPKRVRVLSIPDWGVTPYAAERDREQIAREIDRYNEAKESICKQHGVIFIYITDLTREAADRPEWITTDGLHPAGADYRRWALRVWNTLKTNQTTPF
ncbi:MAG: hypothetical protein RL750_561 [Bacteroidota bacterium]|jgi:lysophospholipase L1-like esterase